MAYSDFKKVQDLEPLGLGIDYSNSLFNEILPVEPSVLLVQELDRNINRALSINTEKARSELIISPVLTEVACSKERGYFSGVEFNVDSEKNLNGFCDFLLTDSNNFMDVANPVICIVEGKNENTHQGRFQCIAEMKAAQIFNDSVDQYILGAVTTGDKWLFMTLENNTVVIDNNECHISQVNKILGILLTPFEGSP